ncbi:hypothetical protein CLOL250_01323 [Clostridium sp. L2-50]|nr:hypothetical protein CLOL250_01323 [Clostridium sp. L2-50]
MKILVYFVLNINYFIEFSLFYSVFSAKIVFFSIIFIYDLFSLSNMQTK